MNTPYKFLWLSILILASYQMTGCGGTPVQLVTPNTSTTPNPPVLPTYSQPPVPVFEGTRVPVTEESISPDSASRVVQIACWGKGRMTQAVLSPDGNTLGVAGSIGVIFYNSQSLNQEAFYSTDAEVSQVIFSPDGRSMAAALTDNSIIVWDVANSQPRHILNGHRNSVGALAFSPDGLYLTSESIDGDINLWDLTSGESLRSLKGTGFSYSIVFSPDGKTVASDLGGDSIIISDAASGQTLRTIQGTMNTNSIVYSPDIERNERCL
jgi:WD40 repeat protein